MNFYQRSSPFITALLLVCVQLTSNAQAVQEADIWPGFGSSDSFYLTEYNGKLYFSANNGINGYELWSYDGSSATLEADIAPGMSSSYPRYLTPYGNKLYFTADDGTNGEELWRFNI